jgi:hypothetical protein
MFDVHVKTLEGKSLCTVTLGRKDITLYDFKLIVQEQLDWDTVQKLGIAANFANI